LARFDGANFSGGTAMGNPAGVKKKKKEKRRIKHEARLIAKMVAAAEPAKK
jgi:hypothetical protein